MSRNETNARFVLRHITDRAHELVEQPIPPLPAELMARAHAVLLYQIMLICSNDVSSPLHHGSNQNHFAGLSSMFVMLF